eukprot:9127887-Pyramimonas_sp.AAC.1
MGPKRATVKVQEGPKWAPGGPRTCGTGTTTTANLAISSLLHCMRWPLAAQTPRGSRRCDGAGTDESLPGAARGP